MLFIDLNHIIILAIKHNKNSVLMSIHGHIPQKLLKNDANNLENDVDKAIIKTHHNDGKREHKNIKMTCSWGFRHKRRRFFDF